MRPLILLTNDDGIESPGLAALAAAVADLGDLLIVAPRVQQSGMGRAMPIFYDGKLFERTVSANGRSWPGYAANASPAQAVQHAVLELAARRPDLAISGINYGENVGTGITVSGTVGAALEAAAHGIPALAVSLQTDVALHLTLDESVDFTVAAQWARRFAEQWLRVAPLPDVDVLKIDIPSTATLATPWRITALERRPYFIPVRPERASLEDQAPIGYRFADLVDLDHNTDAAAVLRGDISVTPLTLDITAPVAPDDLAGRLRGVAPRADSGGADSGGADAGGAG